MPHLLALFPNEISKHALNQGMEGEPGSHWVNMYSFHIQLLHIVLQVENA